jgi:hypothetical protein
MSEQQKRSFWSRLFKGSGQSRRQDKVLEYIVHRIDEGTNLRDVMEEEYVLRNLSRSERESIISNPRIVEAARERMQKDFKAGRPDAGRR